MRTRKPSKKATVTLPLKRFIARRIAAILRERQITQTQAAYLMQDAPSQVSLVVTGKIHGFSLERLMVMLMGLGETVTVVIRSAKRKTGRLTYIARDAA